MAAGSSPGGGGGGNDLFGGGAGAAAAGKVVLTYTAAWSAGQFPHHQTHLSEPVRRPWDVVGY